LNDVGAASKIFQNFNFPLDLFLLDRFENFDNNRLFGFNVDAFKYLAILSPTNLSNNLIFF